MVGRSGRVAERCDVLTARARSLPERMWPITDGMVANMKSMRPASRSLTASAPLYGTCVAFTFSSSISM
ncbi:hypothetical protein D3C72_1545340 [compost metagenome]